MAIAGAGRFIFRSSAVVRISSRSAPTFRIPSTTHPPLLARRFFRSPAEMSACLESMQPYHSATASALMTSMLTASCSGFDWLSQVTICDVSIFQGLEQGSS